MSYRLLYIILFLFSITNFYGQKVYINEFLSSNVSINADIVDFDDYSDWIELYNADSIDINIGGWFITDNFNNPTRYQFPDTLILKAKSYLLVWADGYNEIPGKTYRRDYLPNAYFTTRYFHLNFNLSRAGEEIAIYNTDTVLVDSVSFGLQQSNVSMGRIPDGALDWYYLGEPTPDASNTTSGVTQVEYCNDPVVSHESGFYESPVTVIISATSPNSYVTYTVDGSRPTSNSELYNSPIIIDSTTVLRLRVFEDGLLPSRIFTYSYFINEYTDISAISIVSFPEMLWDEDVGIYDNQYKGVEIPVTIEYFEPGGAKGFSQDAGLRMSGQASLDYPQKSVTILARERYGEDAFNYQVFPDRELNYYKSIYLRNGGVPDNRLTMMRDAALQKMVIGKMDIDAQEYLPSAVFINGEYWGIYNIRDKITTDFLASINNINPDDIDLLEYNNSRIPDAMDGSNREYLELIDYVEDNDLSVQENYEYVESKIDIDEYINYYIAEIYYNNPWWMNQNVRFWKERKDDGKWRWILFDTDAAFGVPGISDYESNTLGSAAASLPTNPFPLWSTLTFRKLLSNDEFKERFIQKFSGYLNTIFLPDSAIAVIDSIKNNISTSIGRHINRWRGGGMVNGMYPISNMFEWNTNVNDMKQFASQRPKYQRQHIIDQFDLSGMSDLSIAVNEAGSGFVLVNKVEKVSAGKTGTYFHDVPTVLEAVPNPGYSFTGWEGISNESADSISIIIDSDAQITAKFVPVSVNILPALISSDLILDLTNSPYQITENVTVDSSASLTIDAGIEVLVAESKNLIVNGRLMIYGEADNPVIFRANDYSESWGGISIVNAADSSAIYNLTIEDATHGADFTRDKAAISSHNSVLLIDGLTVSNVEAPVYAEYGRVIVRNSDLYTNTSGDLINIKYADFALVENCNLRGNDEFDTDAIDYDQMEGGIIRGNRIFNFYGFNSDAIDLGENSQSILIENNIIYNINDKGVSIGHGSSGIIRRNIIANCGQGVGIKDFDSYGFIEHNTFYGNIYAVACFVKNTGRGGGTADVVNSIIANSRSSSVFVDDLSILNISYSLSNTDELEGTGNIYADPELLNDYRPGLTSPVKDKGNPLADRDPDGSLPDIGAFYVDINNQKNIFFNEIHYNPIEGEEYEFVEIVNGGSETVNLSGYKLYGDVDYTFDSFDLLPGAYLVIAKNLSYYSGQDFEVKQWQEGSLTDGYGKIVFSDNTGTLIDRVDYDSKYWWPEAPDGTGPSLELHDKSLENMISSSWRASYEAGGTPGRANRVSLTGTLYINEFLAGNSSTNTDEYGEYDDWVEIFNASENEINIGGLFITDSLGDLTRNQIVFNSAGMTTIPANGKILLWADNQPEQGALHCNFRLNRNGEQIGLVQITETDTIVIDSITYGAQTPDVSYGRYPDGGIAWSHFQNPTPGDSNLVTSTGDEYDLPTQFYLSQNYPNPFNPITTIKYSLPVYSKQYAVDSRKKTENRIQNQSFNLSLRSYTKPDQLINQSDIGGLIPVKLVIYDILGREMATLVDNQQRPGNYTIKWDASNFSSGIYFYRITAGKYLDTKKMILLK